MSEEESKLMTATLAVKSKCEYDKLSNTRKYPFINFLPFTAPSKEFQQYETQMNAIRKEMNQLDLKSTRKMTIPTDKNYPIQDPNNCTSRKEIINGITCHWIKYKGSNINNGIILQLHGGGYILCSDVKLFAQSELLSKLTGFVCLCIDYSLAPECPLPACVNELISVYKYLLNTKKINSSKIFMTGGSAGGGMILLALQSLKKQYLPQPCGVWLDSPWNCLSSNKFGTMSLMAVGNVDINGNVINNFDLKNEIYSPLYGNLLGLCPMYFTVCATEMLLNDTIFAAEKAYKNGIDVRVDISPFMSHCFAYKVNIFPEAYVQTVVGGKWFMDQMRKQNRYRNSKL